MRICPGLTLPVLGLAACSMLGAFPSSSRAQDSIDEPRYKLVTGQMNRELEAARRSQRLRVSAGPDPDTVWVGYSHTDHWSATGNWWNVYVGSHRPGTHDPNSAVWDWDDLGILASHGVGDSLAGWWPFRFPYVFSSVNLTSDVSRPWWAIDAGNIANYVINQGPGGKRTKGVVGVWHADGGRTQPGGSAVLWTPLAGARSAWCGLRELNDLSVVDQVTNQPFNQAAIDFLGATTPNIPSPTRFPGYCGQWDQMLYRDVAATAGQPLSISFLYRTRMSTQVTTTSTTRTGWFHGDPLAVVAGNFISSTDAGVNTPVDSFTVYVGAPVNEASCLYSDGNIRPVYDPQRRWFSEVLRIFDAPYYRIFGAVGSQPADTNAATPSSGTLTVTATQVDAIRGASGNTGGIVRLVFRVKTNRSFSDSDNGFDSKSRGAAIIDDVTVNGSVIGDFETPEQGGQNSIDNRVGSDPLNVWKSTGKPPSIWFHLENVEDGSITYNDLCGPWDSPARGCNISGTVLTAGNHDDAERHCDSRFRSDADAQHGFMSPTIDLSFTAAEIANNTPNEMGITPSMKDVTDDYYVFYDIYAGMFNTSFQGNSWVFGAQGYPARQLNNGAAVWASPMYLSFQIFNPSPECLWDIEPLFGASVLAVNTPSGLPDSLRVCMLLTQQCYRLGISLGCNSSDGAYFDNISVGFVDRPAPLQASSANAISVGTIVSDVWEFLQDTFPANETASLPASAAFDTAAALIKGTVNNATGGGLFTRFDVLADTIVVKAWNVSGSTDPVYGNQTRADFVFRILPGPGNYATAHARTFPPTAAMPLLRVPTNQATAVAAGDGSFWGEYMAAPGAFSKGDHNGGAFWDYLTWNSCRADTNELNIFPVAGRVGTGLTTGLYANMIHESDPKFATLGFSKFRCFMVDTAGQPQSPNITCDGTIPAWLTTVPRSRTGWDGLATTKEFTKIIPDGLLTPGAHVQYFWRKSPLADPSLYVLDPDTTQVFQAATESSTDGHRWQQFGVLPDRWKDPAFGGVGMACMLYVDLNDARGNERVFVSVMDSIGGTAANKWGAHNGWHAPGIAGATGADLALSPVHGKNQQPGTTWDMYGVKGLSSYSGCGSSLGNRLAYRTGMGLLTGKEARTGPTPEMLRRFYRVVMLASGDYGSGVLGPCAGRSQDDIALLNDFLTGDSPGSTARPRGLVVSGDGFAQSEMFSAGMVASHLDFLNNTLGVTFRNQSYTAVSGNISACADLVMSSQISPDGDVYGVASGCTASNDVLQRNPAVPEAMEVSYYENVGTNGPYVASVYKPATPERNWVTLVDGWDMERSWGRYCASSVGRLAYFHNALMNCFGAMCALGGDGLTLLDVPQAGHGDPFTRFMKVGNSVMRGDATTVRFGVESAQRVRVRVHDVAGRLVRTLADRSFAPGEYAVAWDGADDAGRPAARGVYFARIEFTGRDGGTMTSRVVVLR